ncbi:hypothetical protein HAX54_034791 [Datura stramonium]|uniref:Uncharacterized protein n=1 Tax=Datura stramonium TaxID=4076 RepID=A0ABS8SEW0_DATST|nr:hypothetical protein [Datura stramonium]
MSRSSAVFFITIADLRGFELLSSSASYRGNVSWGKELRHLKLSQGVMRSVARQRILQFKFCRFEIHLNQAELRKS